MVSAGAVDAVAFAAAPMYDPINSKLIILGCLHTLETLDIAPRTVLKGHQDHLKSQPLSEAGAKTQTGTRSDETQRKNRRKTEDS